MRVFIDTSAWYSLLDRDDGNHFAAKQIWHNLVDGDTSLYTSNYVLLETTALIQNRLGMAAVQEFLESISPLVQIEWIHESLHQVGISILLAANRRKLSLVDCTSFALCNQLAVTVFSPSTGISPNKVSPSSTRPLLTKVDCVALP